mmetsp:Transcript_95725/g.189757  ORF Transcript_95725/g.189757 Transcript_95725/m.189757 type:complete len:435 (-) Transcript_95725:252-1556(-)
MLSSCSAAVSAAMSSLNATFSALRFSVASATDLSKALIPSTRAAISSVKVSIIPLVSSRAAPRSSTLRSKDFCLSSVASNSDSQYTFFSSSAFCSSARIATISSIIPITLSNVPPDLPCNARAMKSRRGSGILLFALAACKTAIARRFRFWALSLVCRKEALGSVFLNKSRASSSLRILMVSAIASNSSARVLVLSAHSASFVEQPFASSAKNFLSSARAFAVSSISSFISVISRPTCATRSNFDSMAAVFASSSLVLASIKSANVLIASSSVAVTSANVFSMVSFNCLRMPTISPLAGTYPCPCDKKALSISLSGELISASRVIRRKTAVAAAFCKKLPAIPPSIAAVALPSAAMFVLRSDDSFENAAASFSRKALAVAIVFFASATFALCCLMSFSSCTFVASAFSNALDTCGNLLSAASIDCVKSFVPVLQ